MPLKSVMLLELGGSCALRLSGESSSLLILDPLWVLWCGQAQQGVATRGRELRRSEQCVATGAVKRWESRSDPATRCSSEVGFKFRQYHASRAKRRPKAV